MNLKIYHICALSLKDVTTTERDMKKRVIKRPHENERDKTTDLIEDGEEVKIEGFADTPGGPATPFTDSYSDMLKQRMFKTSTYGESNAHSVGDNVIDNIIERGSVQVYSRQED